MSIFKANNEVKTVIEGMLDTEYLRAADQEANVLLESMPLSCVVAIQRDNTTITTSTYPTGFKVKIIPIEIYFVIKQNSQDDNQEEVDDLVSLCERKADEFFDKLIRRDCVSKLVDTPDYNMARAEALRLFDTVVTGVLFTCSIPINQEVYYCHA